jgi:hypothetical protein
MPFMNYNAGTAADRDTCLEGLAAALTSAAYPVALRHGMGGSWLELELDLWRVLGDTVRKWGPEMPRPGWPGRTEVWRNGLLAELTEGAYRAARRQGLKAPVLEVEAELYEAFRAVLKGGGLQATGCAPPEAWSG